MYGWRSLSLLLSAAAGAGFLGVFAASELNLGAVSYTNHAGETAESVTDQSAGTEPEPVWPRPLERDEYNARLLRLADYEPPATTTIVIPATATSATTTRMVVPPSPLRFASSTNVTVTDAAWPPAAPYPHGGAILPFQRILAYYGNFYSRYMGILGEYDPAYVLEHLAGKQAEWEAADPDTPVLPAIEYIAMVAQADAGADGMYRAVMPDAEIEKAYELAQSINGILILDLQVGLSTLERELPKFRDFLTRPDVHLAIDPEFSMKRGDPPGTVIGTFDAADINYAIDYLAELVREYQLPPKVLIVHRFTYGMVTGYERIAPQPEVQVVINMDGWGSKDLKRTTYRQAIFGEPVQFAGIKLFYKNDLKPPSSGLLTPTEVLNLHPEPIYIQYQ